MITPRLALAASVLALAFLVPSTLVAESASAAPAKTFKNCTELHKTYKAGVAKPGTKYNVIHHAGKKNENRKITGSPKFDLALYNANKKLDADNDGIACELS
jgi:hypothetical protein